MRTDPYLRDVVDDKNPTFLMPLEKNNQLWQRYQDDKQKDPMLFPTEGAKALGVSEFELLLSSPHSRYLGQDCRAMLSSLERLGRVQSIVRNEFCVHEMTGFFKNMSLGDKMGLTLGDGAGALDLRLFLDKWAHMLWVENPNAQHPSRSLQFFDDRGQAIDKVFLGTDSFLKVADELVSLHTAHLPYEIELLPIERQDAWRYHPLSAEDKLSFEKDWRLMTDIHQFHGILRRYQLDRPSSFVQAPKGYTKALTPSLLKTLFEWVIEAALPLMVFVGNTGMVQIYSGQIHTLKYLGDWLNILDEDKTGFSLHLKFSAITQLWLIRRPNGEAGDTLALEAFDDKGNSLITLFGERSEGKRQDPRWQSMLERLSSLNER